MTRGSVITVFNCFNDTYKFKGSFSDRNYMPHAGRVLKCITYMTNNQTYMEFFHVKATVLNCPKNNSI